MSEYDNNGRGALWKREQRHEKDVLLSGNGELACCKCGHPNKFREVAFRNTNTHEKSPTLDTKYEHIDAPVEKPQQKSDNNETFGDDIPF